MVFIMKMKKFCRLCAIVVFAVLYMTACAVTELPQNGRVAPESVPYAAEPQAPMVTESPEPDDIVPAEEPENVQESNEAQEGDLPLGDKETAEDTVQTESEPPREPELIGEFATPIVDNTPSRLKNLELACAYINGRVLEPGAEFSFNAVVGVRTGERGFEMGYVFVGNQKQEQIGGGICQISSTLYNAALGAGMEITERHPHMRRVDYVKAGSDATVSYGELDFRFRNARDSAVKIEAYIADGEAVALIWLI